MSNIGLSHILSEKELRTRKLWFFSLLTTFFFGHLYNCFEYVGLVPRRNPEVEISIWILISGFCLFLGFTNIFYRFAYQKPGTRLLGIFLLLTPISLFIILREILHPTNQFTPIFVIHSLITCWNTILNYKMWKINKKIQSFQASSVLNMLDVSPIQEATNLEDLDSKYFTTITKWPQYAAVLKTVYREKKNRLRALQNKF